MCEILQYLWQKPETNTDIYIACILQEEAKSLCVAEQVKAEQTGITE